MITNGEHDHLQRWFGQHACDVAVRKLALEHGEIVELDNACCHRWVDLVVKHKRCVECVG